MGLQLYGQLITDVPSSAFGFTKTPQHVRHDLAASMDKNTGYTMAGVRVIPQAGVLTLEPVAFAMDTLTTDWTLTGGSWGPATGVQNKIALHFGNASADVLHSASFNTALPTNAAFYAYINWGQAPIGATISNGTMYRNMTIGADAPVGGGAVPVRLLLIHGRAPFLQVAKLNDAGSAWVWGAYGENGVQGASRCEDLIQEFNRSLPIRWEPVPSENMLICDIGNGREVLVIQTAKASAARGEGSVYYVEAQTFNVAGGSLVFEGMNGVASYQYFPMRFMTGGSVISPTMALPFVWQGNGFCTTPKSVKPAGTTITTNFGAVDGTGLNIAYTVALTSAADGTGYAPTTPIIPSVHLNIPPTYSALGTMSVPVLTDHTQMADVVEDQWLDRVATADGSFALAVRSRVGIKFTNSDNRFSGYNGNHMAARWSRGVLEDGVPVTDYIPHTTGWAGMQTETTRQDPWRYFDLVLEDRTFPLRDVVRGPQEYKDEWCMYAAMADEAIKGGVDASFLDPIFLQCDPGPNPPNCTHFKLPVGTAVNPRSAFSPMQSWWDVIMEIAGMQHLVVGWDFGSDLQASMLRAYPYYPTAYETAFSGTYTTQNAPYINDQQLITICNGALELSMDTSERRTGVAFFGTDASTRVPQGTFLNLDDFPGFERFTENVQGYRKPLVVVSNLFNDPQATYQYALAALQKVAMPTMMVRVPSLFQPTASVWNRFDVYDPKTFAGLPSRFSAERVQSHWTNPASLRNTFQTMVTGRSLYNI